MGEEGGGEGRWLEESKEVEEDRQGGRKGRGGGGRGVGRGEGCR